MIDNYEFDTGTGSFADIYKRILVRVRNRQRAEFVYHTNRLEGSLLPLHGTRKILAEKPINNKQFRTNDILLAQQTLRAMKFVYRLVFNHCDISEADIRNIHFMLSDHIVKNAGEYRTNDINLITPPSEISRQMRELVNFINRKDPQKLDPIEQSACVHYRFSQIHPFMSHNNAVARLLMNMILIRYGYPFTIINATYKQEYLEALAKEDSVYFLAFVTKAVLNTQSDFLVRIKECLIPAVKPNYRV